jgi:hypothetical protein
MLMKTSKLSYYYKLQFLGRRVGSMCLGDYVSMSTRPTTSQEPVTGSGLFTLPAVLESRRIEYG